MLEYEILIKLLRAELCVHMLSEVMPRPPGWCLDFPYNSSLQHLSF